MKSFLNKLAVTGIGLGFFLAGSMPALASGVTQDLGVSDKTGVSEVVYDTASEQEFTVIIPKKIKG